MSATQLRPGLTRVDMRPWFIYARKSRVGVGATITKENQWGACEDHARAVAPAGVELVFFFDNASGYDETASRPEWEEMLEGIRAGQAGGVVGWHVDRFTRIPEIGEHLWKACKRNGTQLHTKLGGHQTSALAFRMQNAVAADESEVKSERQKLKQAQLARDGLPRGGRRAYGYNAKRTELVEAEAAHVRWAAQQVLAGRSLRSITADLNERGSRTVSGGLWRSPNLGTYLRRPMLAAQRTHHGAIVGAASWPAILDLGTWDAVRELLEKPGRRISKSAPRVYLLSGIARCGGCGGAMRGRSGAYRDLGPAYHCERAQGGCAHRRADLVDAQVRAWVVARLAQIDATGASAPTVDTSERATLEGAISELEARQLTAARMHMRGQLTEAQLIASTQEAESELADLRTLLAGLEIAVRRPAAVLGGLAGMANAGELYDARNLEERRAVVQLLARVTIQPGARGRAYDPNMLTIEPA